MLRNFNTALINLSIYQSLLQLFKSISVLFFAIIYEIYKMFNSVWILIYYNKLICFSSNKYFFGMHNVIINFFTKIKIIKFFNFYSIWPYDSKSLMFSKKDVLRYVLKFNNYQDSEKWIKNKILWPTQSPTSFDQSISARTFKKWHSWTTYDIRRYEESHRRAHHIIIYYNI